MRILAMYLPQYYQNEDNDRWWGEGFTDWTAVKAAKPLYEGHNQPRVPLNNNYYNLLDKSTMQWQSKLMKEYGVDGICMYHYWFKDGRRALEKPEQNLLKWKDIDMPFCFCWANETWARSWSNIPGVNKWVNKRKSLEEQLSEKRNEKEVLLQQGYGEKEDWEKHFEYLLPFFKDERYIKIEGKPVFIVYRPDEVYCWTEMFECWNECAQKAGIPPIYLIATNSTYGRKPVNAMFYHSPFTEYSYEHTINPIRIEKTESGNSYSYSEFNNALKGVDVNYGLKTYYCGMPGYDDTPRRGADGFHAKNSTPELFRQQFELLLQRSVNAENDLVFVNAWNEWGEGMYLEPDETYGYQYLEAIRDSIRNFKGKKDEDCVCESVDKRILWYRNQVDKLFVDRRILDAWNDLHSMGRSIEDCLRKRGIGSVIIRGYGFLGKKLERELNGSKIEIKAIIDKNMIDGVTTKQEIVLESEDYRADAIIIALGYEMSDVWCELKQKTDIPIYGIENILYEGKVFG